ncbi:hypothetical protein KIW84_035898 [Lathyrus oleraceus]|uniref:Tf2-1-like SH3-like domain-containing protein n=1 Tax=Pisum sativum TaxID=3888 RepID=A0A9D5B6N6_PEA|nr:hypothetical protein KIW84_035898 [Pisum sativum]
MRIAQSRQKSYHDKRRKSLEFQEGDHVFLRVTPITGVGRALKSKKLTPRFIGPYQILERIGEVAYRIALPPSLEVLHVKTEKELRKGEEEARAQEENSRFLKVKEGFAGLTQRKPIADLEFGFWSYAYDTRPYAYEMAWYAYGVRPYAYE